MDGASKSLLINVQVLHTRDPLFIFFVLHPFCVCLCHFSGLSRLWNVMRGKADQDIDSFNEMFELCRGMRSCICWSGSGNFSKS